MNIIDLSILSKILSDTVENKLKWTVAKGPEFFIGEGDNLKIGIGCLEDSFTSHDSIYVALEMEGKEFQTIPIYKNSPMWPTLVALREKVISLIYGIAA